MKPKAETVRHSTQALLICDMLNTFDFPEAKQLLPDAKKCARKIAKLKAAAKRKKIPVIYVNDHFGHWHADWKDIWHSCTDEDGPGKEIAEVLKPEQDDYFILKPKHSAFHSTPLDILLRDIGARRLIITGIAGNICVLFTAHDAHMREYEVIVPKDCVASNTKSGNDFALEQLRDNFKMRTPSAASLSKSF